MSEYEMSSKSEVDFSAERGADVAGFAERGSDVQVEKLQTPESEYGPARDKESLAEKESGSGIKSSGVGDSGDSTAADTEVATDKTELPTADSGKTDLAALGNESDPRDQLRRIAVGAEIAEMKEKIGDDPT